ncbi:MAG: phosphatidate cytidylyltransferase [Bacillota bacterium]|nr:phosphatidate cytidylyltransferase [Bacillota bacterium]
MLKDRLIWAIPLIVVACTILLLNNVVIYIAVVAVSLISLYEIYSAFGYMNKKTFFMFIYFIPWLFFTPSLLLFWDFISQNMVLVQIGVYAYMLIGFLLVLLNHNTIKINDMLAIFAICTFITFFLMFIVKIRQDIPHGKSTVWAVFVSACLTDAFAYFTGKHFGKHKLAPLVSPNKTIEGSFGGILGSIISMLLYGFIVKLIIADVSVSYLNLAILGFIASIISQIGDLTLSSIKRELNIKDYGKVIPGHGGLLDRIDSILFVAPCIYLYTMFFPIFM